MMKYLFLIFLQSGQKTFMGKLWTIKHHINFVKIHISEYHLYKPDRNLMFDRFVLLSALYYLLYIYCWNIRNLFLKILI